MLKDPEKLIEAFQQGAIFAYPTEAVFGLGCDPTNHAAIDKILQLKKRPASKGVILIAATYSQLLPYVNDAAIPMDKRTEIFSSWPGPYTWLLPKSNACPAIISGESDKIAVRVTKHPSVVSLCQLFESALVSTSANEAGLPPAVNQEQAFQYFSDNIILIEGKVGDAQQPSQIQDALTGKIIRASNG